jgi:hypothetical protein
MPAGRRPEAARERDVSSRPREPHSPHRRRHPRGDVLRERDDSGTNVLEMETICKENNPGSGRRCCARPPGPQQSLLTRESLRRTSPDSFTRERRRNGLAAIEGRFRRDTRYVVDWDRALPRPRPIDSCSWYVPMAHGRDAADQP